MLARDYLKEIANGDEHLNEAATCYEKVAADLRVVWESFATKQWPTAETFGNLAQSIRISKETEEQAILLIKMFLGCP